MSRESVAVVGVMGRAVRLLAWASAYGAAWTLIGVFSASQLVLSYAASGNSASTFALLRFSLPLAYAWALAAPLVYGACRRFPLEARRWNDFHWLARSFLHLAFSLLLAAVVAWLYLALRGAFGIPSRRGLFLEYANSVDQHVLTYGFLLVLFHAWHYFRRSRRREVQAAELQAQLADARLEALRVQLQPHFLFNTLHAISAFVRSRPETAEDMLAQLAELLRATLEDGDLEDGGGHEVTLRRELDLTRRYLAIQETRFGDRLAVSIDVEARLLDARVPRLLLQPLVENAVEHTIGQRRRGGRLDVTAALEDGALEIRVSDDGPGLPENAEGSKPRGVGLRNTEARLSQLYGPAGRLRLEPRPEGGLTARVTLPFRRREEPGA